MFLFQGCPYLRVSLFQGCSYFRGVLISGVSLYRSSTVNSIAITYIVNTGTQLGYMQAFQQRRKAKIRIAYMIDFKSTEATNFGLFKKRLYNN